MTCNTIEEKAPKLDIGQMTKGSESQLVKKSPYFDFE